MSLSHVPTELNFEDVKQKNCSVLQMGQERPICFRKMIVGYGMLADHCELHNVMQQRHRRLVV